MTHKPDSAPPSPAEPRPHPGGPGSASGAAPSGNSAEGEASRGSGSFGSQSHADTPTRVSDSRVSRAGASTEPAEQPTIDGYEIHAELHRGGQGIVYRATQLGTKRPVALKVLLEGEFASETTRRRFEREVELAASLRHPYIVTILDSGASRGRLYFVMEFVDGVRLDHYLQQHPLSLRETLALLEKVCDAVNFAHQRGVIHRDLKPSNILIVEEQSSGFRLQSSDSLTRLGSSILNPEPRTLNPQPKVLDFGLAKVERSSDPRETTVQALSITGQVVGTLAYMSPEQAAGSDLVDVRSDVYSLGVIFYEALLGRTPYPVGGPLGEVLNRIAKDDPLRPRSVRLGSRFGKQIGDELETILLKALEKDPARRYQTAGDLGRDLRHYLAGEPIEAKRASGLYMLRKTLSRYRLQAAFAGALLIGLVMLLFLLVGWYQSERRARAESEELRRLANVETERARAAALAEAEAKVRESQAREAAEGDKRRAERTAESLRLALVRQKTQRGDLAQVRGDLIEARDSYWDAYDDSPDDPAGLWELRQYYSQTGDAGAANLFYRKLGPMALSPDGRLLAVCETSHSIVVRETQTGRSCSWIPTPGDVRVLSIDNHQRIAAAGTNWLKAWRPSSPEAEALIHLPETADPRAVHLAYEGQVAVLVQPRSVDSFDVVRGDCIASQELRGELAGAPDASGVRPEIALPTSSGVELLSVLDDGRLSARVIWGEHAPRAARAVRFVETDMIAVLSDGVDLVSLAGDSRGRITRVLTSIDPWDLLDAAPSAGLIAVATRQGRAALFHGETQIDSWRISDGGLADLRVRADGPPLLTIDDGGAATRWTPPARLQQRRQISNRRSVKWVTSADGSTLIMIDSEGRVSSYNPQRGAIALPVVFPNLMGVLRGRSPQDILLATSADGSQIVAADDSRIWVKSSGRPRATPQRWSNAAASSLKGVAISGDGQLLATFSQTSRGDRQIVSFQPTETRVAPARGEDSGPPTEMRSIEFTGGLVRSIQFLPNSTDLLVARANAELIVLSGGSATDEAAPTAEKNSPRPFTDDPWTVLDSPAYRIAFDRGASRIAAACDDGVVRVLALLDTSELAHLTVGRDVRALAFDSAGEVLLVRTADGAVSLYGVDAQERIAHWPAAATIATPLAAWIGRDDAIVQNDGDGVFESQYRAADETIKANRAYAHQRHIVRRLADGDPASAWLEAVTLRTLDEALGRDAQVAIVDQMLRRARVEPPPGWVETALDGATAYGLLRLGHAACEGGRFALAHPCLAQARSLLCGTGVPPVAAHDCPAFDALSVRRLAECEYLVGDPGLAADMLGALLRRPSFTGAEKPQVTIEWLAALVRANRGEQARAELKSIESAASTPGQNVATVAMTVLGKLVVEHDPEAKSNEMQKMLLKTFAEQFLDYRDDIEFFTGENARARGDLTTAAQRYQLCIDVARDEWPANWARFRLKQMAEAKP